MAFGIGYILGGIVTLLVATAYLHQPLQALAANPKLIEENGSLARILQVVGTLFMFGLPAFVFAYITRKEKALSALGFTRAISIKQVFYTLLIIAAALWVSEGLTLVNQWIPIPAGNAYYFKQLEDNYTKQAIALLDLKDISGYLISLFIIALLPAILEELIFRACLQKVLYGLSKHAFLSIFLTSIVFSAIHMSYYEFLPRFFLGMVLGYMFHYSNNIWLNIGFHLVNNALTITLMYIAIQSGKTMQQAIDSSGITGNIPDWAVLLGSAVLLAVIYFLTGLFKRESEHVLAVHTRNNDTSGNETTGSDSINLL